MGKPCYQNKLRPNLLAGWSELKNANDNNARLLHINSQELSRKPIRLPASQKPKTDKARCLSMIFQ
jgi:hypothetical protein